MLESSKIDGEGLSITFGLNAISPLEIWNILFDQLKSQGVSLNTMVDLYGKQTSLEKVYDGIHTANRGHFGFELGELSINYSPVTNYDHALLKIKDNSVQVSCDWNQWVNCFLSHTDFIQAWVVNNEYNYWQNAEDTIHYISRGKSYDGLPLISNGLPPPLEQMIVDISHNPGRRIIRMGYVEVVGYLMWLGQQFWERTGIDKRRVMKIFAKESELIRKDILRIQMSDKPFTESSDVAIQDKLREVIFPCA